MGRARAKKAIMAWEKARPRVVESGGGRRRKAGSPAKKRQTFSLCEGEHTVGGERCRGEAV